MSNRDSLGRGDLIPQDVVDILAQEKHNRRSKKKRSNSLGRALGWLKGKKRRDLSVKRENLSGSPEIFMPVDAHPAGHHGGHKGGQRSGRQAPPHGHAVLKLEDEKSPTPPLLQENVFIESSRPKYLENLHSEALEGLKMMQQEESNNGVDCKDNESTVSSMTVQTDGEGGGFVTDSTIGDTTSVTSVQSSVSSRSSRSGLTRQKSTFRPLNSGKKSEKGKTRKRHRKTIGGIPQHVQMELGLDRGGWAVGLRLEENEVYNGETDDGSAPDGPHTTAASQKDADRGSRPRKPILAFNKDQIEQLAAAHAGHRDDIALLHHLVPESSGEHRPQSLAVPWMTTANSLLQKPPSPVMSMSPQAAYMSKIIPNAILPPSIDVVEISRGRSRNSVRTVSHGNLLLSSPAASRPSSRACSSRASTANQQNLSDSSCWSTSGSTETLVSNSSTVSSSTTPRQQGSQDGDRNAVLSLASRASHITNGMIAINGDEVKKEGPLVRSLSVMKPKKAPPPPSRSYSLHNKMKRRSRELTGAGSGESPRHVITIEESKTESKSSPPSSRIIDSPGYNADTSSLEDSTGSASFSPMRSQLQALEAEETAKVTGSKEASQGKQEALQDKILSPSSGYSSQDGSSKPKHGSSTRHKSGILAKLQRLFPGSTPPVTVTPPPPVPEVPESTKPQISVDTSSVNPSVRALIELFNIPPPPKVHAPPPPPPEVWAHSKRSFELLLGPPAPDNISAIIKKNPKDRRQRKSSSLTESAVKSLMVERKHKSPALESVDGAPQMLEAKKGQGSVSLNELPKEHSDRRTLPNADLMGSEKVTEIDEKVRVSNILNGILVKAVEKREERLVGSRKEESKQETTEATEVNTNTDNLPAISLVHISPLVPLIQPPTQTTELACGITEPLSPELSWPPPPPPVGVSGPDDFELPLPPPPVFVDGVSVAPAEKFHPGGGASFTSSLSAVETEFDRVTTEAEPQRHSKSQGNSPLPPNIPPPPPYTAPPPPLTAVHPPPPKVVTPPLPSIREVSPPPPPKEVSSPPPPKAVTSPPPPKEVTPPPPPKEVSPPPPPKEVTPPPPHKEVSPPPPPKAVTSPPPLKEVSHPPPPKEFSHSPPPKEFSHPPPPKEFSHSPPPKEVSPPPPPKDVSPPPPPKAVTPPPPKEVSPPPHKAVTPPPPQKDISPPSPVKEVSLPSVVEEATPAETSFPLVEVTGASTVTSVTPSAAEEEVSPPHVIKVSTVSTTEIIPPSIQDNILKEESPEHIAPLPTEPSQVQLADKDIVLPQKEATSDCEVNQLTSKSVLTPPQSIPPPPPIELPHQPEDAITNSPAAQDFSISAPTENSSQMSPENSPLEEQAPSAPLEIHLPPSLPGQDLSNTKQESLPASTEDQTPEEPPSTVIQEESTPFVPPSVLQTAELPSVNSSSEAPQVQEHPDTEVILRNNPPASSSSSDAPQKPVRKSLIINLPVPTSPPAAVISQPSAPKPEPLAVPPASPSAPSLTTKSPPAASVSPSMNLQEAIRLRTAARSLGVPGARLNLHSPTSPTDLRKSPSSTASFIFAKSNKKVVVQAKPAAEAKAAAPKNQQASSPTKVDGETEQKGTKVPPPVAKKPKTKGREIESEGTEPTAGQEEEQEISMDDAEKTNGTAGTVEEVGPST